MHTTNCVFSAPFGVLVAARSLKPVVVSALVLDSFSCATPEFSRHQISHATDVRVVARVTLHCAGRLHLTRSGSSRAGSDLVNEDHLLR